MLAGLVADFEEERVLISTGVEDRGSGGSGLLAFALCCRAVAGCDDAVAGSVVDIVKHGSRSLFTRVRNDAASSSEGQDGQASERRSAERVDWRRYLPKKGSTDSRNERQCKDKQDRKDVT
jgi:hypothetical protein